MVVAHAAGADAAERQAGLGDVHHRVVDGDAAGDGAFEYLLDPRAIVVEHIQRQRPVVVVDPGDGFIQMPIADHRQNRAKDFVAHQRAVRSEEHTSEIQSLMRTSYAVFCLKKKKYIRKHHTSTNNYTHTK